MPDLVAPLLPSVLDRVLHDGGSSALVQPRSRTEHMNALRDGIRRDLEALLNTHRCQRPPAELSPLEQSLYQYGSPDFFAVNAGAVAAREEFRRALEETIRRFEPRFKTVRVVLLDNAAQPDRTLRFRIDALMYAEPAPEPVSFDSQLDPPSHSFSVTGARSG